MAEVVREQRHLSRGFLWFCVLVLAEAPGLGRSASFVRDETCLIQTLILRSETKNMFDFLTGWWDYDTDVGGWKPVLDENSVPKYPSHPLWKPEWWRMSSAGAFRAGACLFVAGILCCAGGIGGGGIYVTVLMVFGHLSVHDAIPLSKVVVFAASTPSLILNLMKTITLQGDGNGKAKTLIDWNLCRVVVPWALLGTLMGVFLNSVVPEKVIVGLLSAVLLLMVALILRTGYEQHCKEREAETEAVPGPPEATPSNETRAHGMLQAQKPRLDGDLEDSDNSANELSNMEILLSVSMLATIIFCGTLHYWSAQCAEAPPSRASVCRHPIARIVTFGQMANLKESGLCHGVGLAAIFVAIAYCFVLGSIYTLQVVRAGQVYGSLHRIERIGNSYQGVMVGLYLFMSSLTGCLAGLVGVGGGLIFSPFFIQMRIDPHVAVASSATCVFFTSSSTTFQYLFSDRIIVSLLFSFCIPHLAAAYMGTKLVHYIQDYHGARKSWITCIVALGVGVSFVLAVGKLFDTRPVSD